MGTRAEDIRLQHRLVGTKHVFTSPDVPELYVAHADRAFAEKHIQEALDMIERAKARVARRNLVTDMQRERRYA